MSGCVRFETLHRARDGRVYPVEIQSNFLEFEGKGYSCCFVTDISERKRVEEKLLLQQLCIEKADTIFMQFSAAGKILMVNECACRSLGYTADELLELSDVDITPVPTNEKRLEYRKILDAGGSVTGESVLLRKDGSAFPVEFTANKLEFNNKTFYVGFFRNIADRKRAEEAVRESEKKFRLLIETSPSAIIVIQGVRIVYANPAATALSGFTVEQVKGMEAWNFVHEDFREAMRERLLARQRGEPVSSRYLYRIVSGTGDDRWVVAASVPMDYEGTAAILVTLADITEAKRTEEALRESEARLKLAMDMSRLAPWDYDADSGMFRLDDQFYALYGTSAEREGGPLMSPESYFGKFVHPDDIADVNGVIQRTLTDRDGSSTGGMEHRFIRADGEVRHMSVRFDVIRDREGRLVRARGANQDITEQKRAEEERKNLETQLHQVQKMEAIGHLAGGVAHDFNNILTAIMGFAEVMAMRMEQGNPFEHHVRQILSAAERAADLTCGLLAFSRQQVLHVRPIEVCDVVNGIRKMLRRLIPEDIDFRVKTASTGLAVMADKVQIEQVLMNLVTNARDAMPSGGVLTLESGVGVIDEGFVKRNGFGLPGRYAMLVVHDTGCGMDKETREKIFDPFFTTKAVGKGTGLGLSIIYGIVKQHNGFITVDSLPGLGTTFCVYLPLAEQEKQVLSEAWRTEPLPGGRETILLVEDDEVVRDLHRSILEEAGYTVVEASDGREALDAFKERGSCVDILVTDVIMPNMDGKSLFQEIVRIRPHMKVLFMSGYSTDTLDAKCALEDGCDFLPKPVMPSELLKRLREILHRP